MTARTHQHNRTAAERLYDAECALHAAHQTHVDEWIARASDRLHDALVAYLAETGAPELRAS